VAFSIWKPQRVGWMYIARQKWGLVGSDAIPSLAFGKAKAQVPGNNPPAMAKTAASPAAIAAQALHLLYL
jgi:hypothetical protein